MVLNYEYVLGHIFNNGQAGSLNLQYFVESSRNSSIKAGNPYLKRLKHGI